MKNWFTVSHTCDHCSGKISGQEGAFLGAMTINYGIVVFFVLPFVLGAWRIFDMSLSILMVLGIISAVVCPILLYPVSWRIWVWIEHQFLGE